MWERDDEETCGSKGRNTCKGWDGKSDGLQIGLEGLKKSMENGKSFLLKITCREMRIFLELLRQK